jgi:queuine tRNA-ribosyltransferase
MMEMVGVTAPLLPADKPRYLMGVGTPEDLVQAVERGVDFFDCVLPTRNARNGQLFTSRGKIVIRNALYREDAAAADSSCDCPVCRSYSRAYLRHLHQSGEVLGLRLNTLHNIAYYERLMRDMRSAILQGEWEIFRKEFFAARQARGGQNGGME